MRALPAAFLLVAALAGLAAGEEGYSFPAGWRPLRPAAVPSFVSALVKEAPRAGEVKSAERGGVSAFAVRLGDRPGAFREPLSALLGGYFSHLFSGFSLKLVLYMYSKTGGLFCLAN